MYLIIDFRTVSQQTTKLHITKLTLLGDKKAASKFAAHH
jgi:hypothetical protein